MADQKRWFKVWTSIVANAHFAEMSLEDIGRWALLGAATALDGDRGQLEVPGQGKELCRLLRVDDIDAARHALKRLHSVQFEEGQNRHGDFFVTWNNWNKYQEDSTQAARQKTSRSKRRGEEKRREDPPVAPLSSQGSGTGRNEVQVDEAVRKYQPLEAYRLIDVRQAVLNCQNWCVTRKKALTDRRLVNWLNSEAMKAASAPSRTKSPDPYAKFPRVSEGS